MAFFKSSKYHHCTTWPLLEVQWLFLSYTPLELLSLSSRVKEPFSHLILIPDPVYPLLCLFISPLIFSCLLSARFVFQRTLWLWTHFWADSSLNWTQEDLLRSSFLFDLHVLKSFIWDLYRLYLYSEDRRFKMAIMTKYSTYLKKQTTCWNKTTLIANSSKRTNWYIECMEEATDVLKWPFLFWITRKGVTNTLKSTPYNTTSMISFLAVYKLPTSFKHFNILDSVKPASFDTSVS